MRPKDMTGAKFGRLTVVRRDGTSRQRQAMWLCQCECGNGTRTEGANLRFGHVRSCGCLNQELRAERKSIHGGVGTKAYRTWKHLRERCLNPKVEMFYRYGGRGISVCDRWMHSFENFLADMGNPPSAHHSIDRIDNDGNYEPSNCRWATWSQQAKNRSPKNQNRRNASCL